MATSRAARALGLQHKIGTLTTGKEADIIAIDLKSFVETNPVSYLVYLFHSMDPTKTQVYHPVSSIVYSAKREQITDVWVQGRRLLRNRQLTTISLDNVLKQVERLLRIFIYT
jgi:5-methylthioadenosine/S-adenosylhomocysteine deaminase